MSISSTNTPLGSYSASQDSIPLTQPASYTDIEETQEGDVNDPPPQNPPAQEARPPLVRTHANAGPRLLSSSPSDLSD